MPPPRFPEGQPIDVLKVLKEEGVLLDGHFILSSGKRSQYYLQCAKLFEKPWIASRLLIDLRTKVWQEFGRNGYDILLSPAVGGITVGYELGSLLHRPSIFAEKELGFQLRRGFQIKPGQRVLIVEDVITTGGSVKECIKLARDYGGAVIGAACVVDRSKGKADLGVPFVSLVQVDFPVYDVKDLPKKIAKIPATKPGTSR